jgi:hypothetical protein
MPMRTNRGVIMSNQILFVDRLQDRFPSGTNECQEIDGREEHHG